MNYQKTLKQYQQKDLIRFDKIFEWIMNLVFLIKQNIFLQEYFKII